MTTRERIAAVFKCPNCYGEGLPADELPCWKCGSRKPDAATTARLLTADLQEIESDIAILEARADQKRAEIREIEERDLPLIDAQPEDPFLP